MNENLFTIFRERMPDLDKAFIRTPPSGTVPSAGAFSSAFSGGLTGPRQALSLEAEIGGKRAR